MASFAALRMTSSDPNYLSVMPKFYLTTAIDYSNGDPHLGHALEKVGADCIARYRRVRGDQVHFLMGMDEHAQAVIQAAEQNGQTPQAWVDLMAERFADFWRRLEVSNDDWIRTTEPRHRETVTRAAAAHPAAQPGRSLHRRLRGALLHRLRGVQAAGADRERALHRASDAGAGAHQGAQPLLPAEPLPRHAAGADHVGPSSGSSPRSAATRSSGCSRTGCRTSRSHGNGSPGVFPSPTIRIRRSTSGSTR